MDQNQNIYIDNDVLAVQEQNFSSDHNHEFLQRFDHRTHELNDHSNKERNLSQSSNKIWIPTVFMDLIFGYIRKAKHLSPNDIPNAVNWLILDYSREIAPDMRSIMTKQFKTYSNANHLGYYAFCELNCMQVWKDFMSEVGLVLTMNERTDWMDQMYALIEQSFFRAKCEMKPRRNALISPSGRSPSPISMEPTSCFGLNSPSNAILSPSEPADDPYNAQSLSSLYLYDANESDSMSDLQ
eukprot:248848_1